MFECKCGQVNPGENARFCSNCGAEDLSTDKPTNVARYVEALSQVFFHEQSQSMLDKISLRQRATLKISNETHLDILTELEAHKKSIAHFANFRLEFNENVTDAFAGHDTLLSFRYTNLSDDDLFKVTLQWDDPETTDRIDIKAQTITFVLPNKLQTLSAKTMFDRMGFKEVTGLEVTIIDQDGKSAKFTAEPFNFRVASHDQKITQTISTHNQISIEGRGVVDASGMGSDRRSSQAIDSNPIWKTLNCSYYYDSFLEVFIKNKTCADINNSDISSLKRLADKGDPNAQHRLGKAYRDGEQDVKNLDAAIFWFKKAAEQGHPDSQNSLGWHYMYGEGLPENHDKAFELFKKSVSGGYQPANVNIALCYEKGHGVEKDELKARSIIETAAESGDGFAQGHLGKYYALGKAGLDRNYEKAFFWYQKSAAQGAQTGFWNLGVCYHRGQGVSKNIRVAIDWYLKCGESGDHISYERLFEIYFDGEEINPNKALAKNYLEKAIQLGSKTAKNRINELKL